MNRKSISILLSEEAENFVKSQPIKAQKKIYFNIFKVEGGVMDKELFKKTGRLGDLGVTHTV